VRDARPPAIAPISGHRPLQTHRIYLGELSHRGRTCPGRHQAIVAREAWVAAQAFMERRKPEPRDSVLKNPALLARLLFAPDRQRCLAGERGDRRIATTRVREDLRHADHHRLPDHLHRNHGVGVVL
jgi:hypothetical protein